MVLLQNQPHILFMVLPMNLQDCKIMIFNLNQQSILIRLFQLPATTFTEFYSSTIIHTPNSGGEGTVTRNFVNANSPYPGGTPSHVYTNNFAYDDNYLLYQEIDGTNGATSGEYCIDKSKSAAWLCTFMGLWSIYSNGEKVTSLPAYPPDPLNPVPPITATYEGAEQLILEQQPQLLYLYNGQIFVDHDSNGSIDFVCKKVKDGSHLDGINPCTGALIQ